MNRQTTAKRLSDLEQAAGANEPRGHPTIIADPENPDSEYYGLYGDDLRAAVDKRLAELPPRGGIRAILPMLPQFQPKTEASDD